MKCPVADISDQIQGSRVGNRKTHIREENAGNTSPGVDSFLVTLLLISTTLETPMMTSNRVLVRLNTALICSINRGAEQLILFTGTTNLLLPAERQVSGRHDLDEVHVVVCLLVGVLLGVIERIDVVVRPSTGG